MNIGNLNLTYIIFLITANKPPIDAMITPIYPPTPESEVFGVSGEDYSWAQPFPYDSVPEGFTVVAPFDEENPVPSCRNADKPWDPETNFQLTIDGFIISDNVRLVSSDVVDLQFACSDHNPVYMDFILEN